MRSSYEKTDLFLGGLIAHYKYEWAINAELLCYATAKLKKCLSLSLLSSC